MVLRGCCPGWTKGPEWIGIFWGLLFWFGLNAKKPSLLTGLLMLGVDDGTRTHDSRNHNPGLYQLSYSHHSCFRSSTRPFNRRTFDGAPDRIRTCDLCLRRAALYPAELRALRCRTGRIIDDDADLVYSFFDTKNQVPVFQSLPTLFNYFCFVQAGSSNSPLLFESLTP